MTTSDQHRKLLLMENNVETVVLLSQLRQKPDDYIEVDVDVAELVGTSAETKATYEKIKKYVAEHNGRMKVSSLYIAQVKRKCGLKLGENFNLPKSEGAKGPVDLCSARTEVETKNSRQPQCPKEKTIIEPYRAIADIVAHNNIGSNIQLSKNERREIAHVLHNAC